MVAARPITTTSGERVDGQADEDVPVSAADSQVAVDRLKAAGVALELLTEALIRAGAGPRAAQRTASQAEHEFGVIAAGEQVVLDAGQGRDCK